MDPCQFAEDGHAADKTAPGVGDDAAQIARRVRFLFRLAGGDRSARELEQALMAYRLGQTVEKMIE